MRDIRVESLFPRYSIWDGPRVIDHPNKVLVTQADGGEFWVTKTEATKLIGQRDEAIEMIEKLALALQEENEELFNQIWFGR